MNLGCVFSMIAEHIIAEQLTSCSYPLRSKYKSWRPNAESGTTDAYSQQIYDRGTKCWNGVRFNLFLPLTETFEAKPLSFGLHLKPERSTIVEIACGTKNEILSVMELCETSLFFRCASGHL